MTAKQILRALISVLFTVGMTVAQAGGEAVPVSGANLREAALSAARQRSVVEAASRESIRNEALRTASAKRDAVDPLSYTFKLRNTDITLDFCSGTHLLMTSNLDSVTEVIVRP